MLGAQLGLLFVALTLMIAQTAVVAERWVNVLRAEGGDLPFVPAVKLVFVGNFFSQFLISAFGGDVVRMWLAKHHGVSTSHAVTSVLVDRMCALLAIFVLVVASAPWIRSALPQDLYWGALSLAGSAIAGSYVLACLHRLPLLKQGHRWMRMIGSLPQHVASVLFRAQSLLVVAALALLSHCISTVAAYVIGISVGIGVSFVDLIAIFPWVILATALPVSVAGWGVREGAMVWGLALVGGGREEALALSLLYGIVAALASTPGILFWLAPKLGTRRHDS
jgi:uncharacterized membrane protein YbhN (UPF0104 family)